MFTSNAIQSDIKGKKGKERTVLEDELKRISSELIRSVPKSEIYYYLCADIKNLHH